jgi:hypothetical protein
MQIKRDRGESPSPFVLHSFAHKRRNVNRGVSPETLAVAACDTRRMTSSGPLTFSLRCRWLSAESEVALKVVARVVGTIVPSDDVAALEPVYKAARLLESHVDVAATPVAVETAPPRRAVQQCRFCEYSSTDPTKVVRHERTHTGERPFQCLFCGYRAARKDQVIEHERIHTGERPYSCGYCDYRAATVSKIRRHERTHTGEKPFRCSHCDYAATTGNAVTIHQARYHPAAATVPASLFALATSAMHVPLSVGASASC